MAAGLGFKDFTTGEVLTAADVDGYLMQGIWVFANTTARDAAVTAPAEGNFAFTKDTNSLWYYDGAAWVASGATGDIEGVTAGIGISGGGTSGTVTVTNSMATAIDAKGDLIVGTAADTFSRLAVGATNGHVLTVDSTAGTGLKYAAVAGGSLTLLSTTSLSGSSVTVSSIDQTYTHLYLVAFGVTNATSDGQFRLQPNSSASGCYHTYIQGTSVSATAADTWKWCGDQNNMTRTNSDNTFTAIIENYTNTNVQKNMSSQGVFQAASGLKQVNVFGTFYSNSAITAIQVRNDGGNLSTGSLLIYGVK